jgi:hypothetical protein
LISTAIISRVKERGEGEEEEGRKGRNRENKVL